MVKPTDKPPGKSPQEIAATYLTQTKNNLHRVLIETKRTTADISQLLDELKNSEDTEEDNNSNTVPLSR